VATVMGWDPPPITVNLTEGGVFSAAAINKRGSWDEGDAIELYFYGAGGPITWPATLNGDRTRAEWSRSVAQVAAVIASNARSVVLRRVPDGGEPIIWRRGTARVV
jgi:hypothetical protein